MSYTAMEHPFSDGIYRVAQQSSLLPENYHAFLSALKQRIRTAQVKAVLAVNQELVLLYWQIGREILNRQKQEGWGSKIIERLAKDLKQEFPDIKGFSRSNLGYMKAFAEAYPEEAIYQRCVGKLPWRHNVALLEKLDSQVERLWYAQQSFENGWSRDILVMQIESDLYQRQGSAITNFERTLLSPQSDLAKALIKDPYQFSFLNLTKEAQERDLERALVGRIRDFLLELGFGFAFMGSQYLIEVAGDEFYIDLLFYHVKLRCYVVIELKMTEFKPEYSGKMNFYVSAVDDLLRHPDDNPTIGIILCRNKKNTIVEYALRNVNAPIAVSTHNLPKQFQDQLPSAEQLELELEAAVTEIETGAEDARTEG